MKLDLDLQIFIHIVFAKNLLPLEVKNLGGTLHMQQLVVECF